MPNGSHYREFLGARPDLEDKRDYVFRGAPAAALVTRGVRRLAPFIDRRHECGPVWDQGQEPSCVGHAIAGTANHYYRGKVFSRRQLYYEATQKDRIPDEIGGSSTRAGYEGWDDIGAALQDTWPYVANDRDVSPARSIAVIESARLHPLRSYERVRGWSEVCTAIQSHGVVAMTWRIGDAWDDPAGLIEMQSWQEYWGYHAVVGVGCRNGASAAILIRNSWGPGWADGGCCWVSAADFQRNAVDIWVPTIGPKRVKVGCYHRVTQKFRTAMRKWGNGISWDQ